MQVAQSSPSEGSHTPFPHTPASTVQSQALKAVPCVLHTCTPWLCDGQSQRRVSFGTQLVESVRVRDVEEQACAPANTA